MNLLMFSGAAPADFPVDGWTALIVGSERDDRGGEARKYAEDSGLLVFSMLYDSKSLAYNFDGKVAGVDELGVLVDVIQNHKVLIDSTTLGFIEILLLIRAYKISSVDRLNILYIEPLEYASQRSRGVLHGRDFFLSEKSELFEGVPGAAVMITKHREKKAVLLVGYEGDRLQKVLEQTPLEASDCNILLGVPAFQAGWEMNSYANVVSELDERRITSVIYAGATNPKAVYRELQRVLKSCGPQEKMILIPIGTKPHAIGAAIFSVDYPEIGIIYDNPAKKKGRTKEVGKWHLFHIGK